MNQKQQANHVNKKYIKIQKISQGSYGVVYKARNVQTSQIVAIKRFKNITNQGIPVSCIRELHILNILKLSQSQSLQQNNNDSIQRTLKFLQINNQKQQQVQVVFEWMDETLSKILQSNQYNPKNLFKDILKSALQIHENGIIHRDIKSQNIMINNVTGIIKLIDYGMAKQIDYQQKPMTNQVGSLFYRAPELLLGTKYYDHKIDIWALGCVFYQILMKKIFFKGENQLSQINKIFYITGTPKKEDNVIYQIYCKQFDDDENQIGQNWELIKNQINNNKAFQLLKKMLTLNANKRPQITEILQDEYFQQD